LLIQTLNQLHEETGGGMKLIIFSNSKQRVLELADHLCEWTRMAVYQLDGAMDQAARDKSMDKFRREPRNCCLVATALGQRGLSVDDVSHVIVYEMPYDIDDYVHRIGRTARANRTGKSIAFFSMKLDRPISKELVKLLRQGRQPVPDWLQRLADDTDDEAYEEYKIRKSR
jgi:superfamily II DNA/RNA helicase